MSPKHHPKHHRLSKFLALADLPARAHRLWQRGGIKAYAEKLVEKLLGRPLEEDTWPEYRYGLRRSRRRQFQKRIAAMVNPPTISILMPVYNTPEAWLREAVKTVRNQVYPHWQLCLVDDASPAAHVRPLLESLAAEDDRIQVFFRPVNGGISHASNDALALATGEFTVLMDHDDWLTEQALFRVAEMVQQDDPDLFYSDEALVTPEGELIVPLFRPAFSLELLRSHPYIVHLVGFRTKLLREIGGFRSFLTISQDYDLILRASERANVISHIPEILYLWRQHDTSTGNQRKADVMEVSRDILLDHLERCHEPADVTSGLWFNYFQVRYARCEPAKVAIVIPTKNYANLVRQCLESIAATTDPKLYEIVLIDHDSTEPESIAYFQELRTDHLVLNYSGPFNFSAINNWAVEQVKDRGFTHYLFCNNDIEAIEIGWLERLVEYGQKPDVGIVGAKLLYPDHLQIQHAGVCIGMHGMAEHFGKFRRDRLSDGRPNPGYMGGLLAPREVSSVTAACLLMRRDAFEAIEGYDETLAVGFGDVDLCLRVRAAGYRIVFCPSATLVHHESYTRGKAIGYDPHPEDSAKFFARWQHLVREGDPFHNPNFQINSYGWEAKAHLELPSVTRSRCYDRQTHQFRSRDPIDPACLAT